ncbi:hypothetical protein [Anaerohalosphaera lusitana]|uniref:hypothetical protein n=1 Tax=Anaerohalosphaera lusitana TaxID=1936003 RepID=UPI00147462D3|nr:hypothetical protein [Anaerohalosphaera lusitana]
MVFSLILICRFIINSSEGLVRAAGGFAVLAAGDFLRDDRSGDAEAAVGRAGQ